MSHLSLGLSKRLSSSASPPKRRSVNLSITTGNRRNGAPSSAEPPLSTPSDITSDDGYMTSRTAASGLDSMRVMKEQKTEIDRLQVQVADLQEELLSRPTEEELDSMRKEWETSEDLFAQSQKDNEQKHATIEHLKQYIKALEQKLEELLGAGWQDCCTLPQAPTMMNPGAAFATNMPLPRPGTNLPRSSSTRRLSRNSRVGSLESSRLREIMSTSCEKTTPASALRKLEGASESVKNPPTPNSLSMSARSSTSTVDCMEVDGLIDSPVATTGFPSSPTTKPGFGRPAAPSAKASDANTPPNTSASKQSTSSPMASPDTKQARVLADQVAQLTALVRALPTTIVTQADDERAAERARIEEQKLAMLEMLDAAEQRADAREMRLQAMIAEVGGMMQTVLTHQAKACSGQMGW